MTQEANKGVSAWLPPFSFVVVALLIGLVSFAFHIIPFILTGQAFLLIILIRTFACWPPMVRWVGSMPVFHRAVFILIIGSMILGHYRINTRDNFPFITWFIFPAIIKKDPITCREFIATTASGRKVRLLTEQLFPSIIQIDELDRANLFPPETLEHLAKTLAKAYSSHHADDPVRQVDLVVMAVELHPPPTESRAEPSCQLLKSYDFSSGL